MTWVKWALVYYGVFNIALGIMGFQAGSPQSLYFGGGAGLLVLIATAISFKQPRIGYIIALLIALAIGGRFGMVFIKDTSKIYPAGLIAIASLITIICLLAGHMLSRSGTKQDLA